MVRHGLHDRVEGSPLVYYYIIVIIQLKGYFKILPSWERIIYSKGSEEGGFSWQEKLAGLNLLFKIS